MWKLIGLGRCAVTPVFWDIMIIANMVQIFFYFKPFFAKCSLGALQEKQNKRVKLLEQS